MKGWIDTFPHTIYASVLLEKEKLIDYKIGQRRWTHPFDVTLRGQLNSIDELMNCEVKSIKFIVNNIAEHNKVFSIDAKEWIREQGLWGHILSLHRDKENNPLFI